MTERRSIGDEDTVTDRKSGQEFGNLRGAVLVSGLAYILIAGASFLQYAIVSRTHGTIGLAEFSQVMRVRGILEFAAVLILPMAITRRLAMASPGNGESDRNSTILSGLISGCIALAIVTAVILILRDKIAFAFFGSHSFDAYIPAFCVLLVGYSLCLLVASIGRGIFCFTAVNLMQVTYLSLMPVMLQLIGSRWPLESVIYLIGIQAVIVAVVFLAVFIKMGRIGHSAGVDLISGSTSLLTYSMPRMLTIAGMGAFNLSLPWLVSGTGNLECLAALNGTMGVVLSTSIIASPVGFVVLPVLSRMISTGDAVGASDFAKKIMILALVAGCMSSILVVSSIDILFDIWLAGKASGFHPILLCGAIAVPFVIILESLRNPIDAVSARPLNAITYWAGSLSIVCTYISLRSVIPDSIGLLAGVSVVMGYAVATAVGIGILIRFFRIDARSLILNDFTLYALLIWMLSISTSVVLSSRISKINHAAIQACWLTVYMVYTIRKSPEWAFVLLPAPIRAKVSWLRA